MEVNTEDVTAGHLLFRGRGRDFRKITNVYELKPTYTWLNLSFITPDLNTYGITNTITSSKTRAVTELALSRLQC